MEQSFAEAIFGIPDPSSPCEIFESHGLMDTSNSFPKHHESFNYDSDNSHHSVTNFSNESYYPKENYLYCPSSANSANSEDEVGPFSMNSLIPIPGMMSLSRYRMWLETSFMCKRNERERQRVRNVNDGFSRLRNHLPRSLAMKRRQSKVETLQHAIKYIKHLQSLLKDKKETDEVESK